MRGQKHSADVKAAVMAALLSGQAIDAVAQTYNLPYHTVYQWQSSLTEDDFKKVQNQRRDEIGALLMGYLHETLTTLTVQARFFRNETWLSEQSASDVAILHGVAADKSLRLLEAIERANQANQAEELPERTPRALSA